MWKLHRRCHLNQNHLLSVQIQHYQCYRLPRPMPLRQHYRAVFVHRHCRRRRHPLRARGRLRYLRRLDRRSRLHLHHLHHLRREFLRFLVRLHFQQSHRHLYYPEFHQNLLLQQI